MSKIELNALDQTSLQAAALSAERIGSEIITQTLDALNAPTYGKSSDAMSQTYNLSKNVLGAAYEGKGTILDSSLAGNGATGADIITQTLDNLNAPTYGSSNNSMSQTYNLSKDVLSAAYLGKGTIVGSNS